MSSRSIRVATLKIIIDSVRLPEVEIGYLTAHCINYIESLKIGGECVIVKNLVVFRHRTNTRIVLFIQMEESYVFNDKTFNEYMQSFVDNYNTQDFTINYFVTNKTEFFEALINYAIDENYFLLKGA